MNQPKEHGPAMTGGSMSLGREEHSAHFILMSSPGRRRQSDMISSGDSPQRTTGNN